MNKDKQTTEDKLREAAIKRYGNNINSFGGQRDGFIEGAKSEAAKEYHQSQQPKPDLKEIEYTIRNMLSLYLNNFYQENGLSVPCKVRTNKEDEIIKAILPHLQPQSDAVEFAEWLLDNCQTDSDGVNKAWYHNTNANKTSEELYTEFKQSNNK